MDDKKRNNSSWCCDQIEEKIKDYKVALSELDKLLISQEAKEGVKRQLEIVIDDLENILYE